MKERSRLAVESPEGSKTEPDVELTDEQWLLIEDLFPESSVGPQGGRPMVASRPCVEGIIWILRSGARWKDLPKRFPSASTCWRRLQEWTEAGVWEKAWGRLLRILDRQGRVHHEESMADGTFASAKKGVKSSERPNAAKGQRSWSSSTAVVFRSARIRQAPARTK